jgi:HEAT repeat protein
MKVRAGSYLAVLFLFFALTVPVIAQSDLETFLKTYGTPKDKIRVGFVPYKTQVVLGEPLQVTFTVQNLGSTNFEFWFGGDYRGTGRHDRFKIAVTNANGEALPDPIAHIFDFGGILQPVNLKPGQFFTNAINLTDFRVIDKAGIYIVGCSFALDGSWKGPEKTDAVAETIFKLTILERTPERIARVLDELIEKAKVSHKQNLNDTLALAATFGKDDAVSRLIQLATNGPIEIRVAAIGVLPLVPSDASLNTVLDCLNDSDPAIRSAAAKALGAMPSPRAVEALLRAFPNEKNSVAEAIVLVLGATKSESAFPVITNAFDHGDVGMQRAAVTALVYFGDSNAITALQGHINTNFLAVRHDIVCALVEELHQPMQPEWLAPILIKREQDGEWIDSLRLMRLYAGDKAVPALLSYVDFNWTWSDRNWWILNEVQACQNAPHINYENYKHDSDCFGTPEQWTNSLKVLQLLKPFAAQVRTYILPVDVPSVPILKTDPPIDFTPVFQDFGGGDARIISGFLKLEFLCQGISYDYNIPDYDNSAYVIASHFRSLANYPKNYPNLAVSQEQLKQLNDLLHQFAVKLCGSDVSNQQIENYYHALVSSWTECPYDYSSWISLHSVYSTAPPDSHEQAKANLLNTIQAFSQNYHSGTVEFAEKAQKIFTPEQLKQILE